MFSWPPAAGSVGAVLAIVVLILAILGLFGVFPHPDPPTAYAPHERRPCCISLECASLAFLGSSSVDDCAPILQARGVALPNGASLN